MTPMAQRRKRVPTEIRQKSCVAVLVSGGIDSAALLAFYLSKTKRSSAMSSDTRPKKSKIFGFLLVALMCPEYTSASAVRLSFEVFSISGDGLMTGLDINNSGDIVGVVDDFGSGSRRRVGFERRAGVIALIDFAEAEPVNGTYANGINDAGLVVGRFTEVTSGLRTHAFIKRGEQRELFDAPGTSSFTEALDINNRGVIVGRTFLDSDRGIGSAFVRTEDEYQFFRPDFVRGPFGCAFYGLNDRGNMVGRALEDTGFRAFAMLDGAYMSFTIPGSYTTVAEGINNADQIIGWYCAPDCFSVHGFLMDFSGLYRIDAPVEGSYGTVLSGVNDEGMIAGAVLFHQFPVRRLLVGSPCEAVGDPCVDAARISDPLIDFSLKVDLDIRAGSGINPINPYAHGVIPVAILGSDVFHVVDVDESTLAFGPDGAAAVHSSTMDVNRDGFADLIVQFRTEDTGIVAGDSEACAKGELLSGRPFRSCDAVRTVPRVAGR